MALVGFELPSGRIREARAIKTRADGGLVLRDDPSVILHVRDTGHGLAVASELPASGKPCFVDNVVPWSLSRRLLFGTVVVFLQEDVATAAGAAATNGTAASSKTLLQTRFASAVSASQAMTVRYEKRDAGTLKPPTARAPPAPKGAAASRRPRRPKRRVVKRKVDHDGEDEPLSDGSSEIDVDEADAHAHADVPDVMDDDAEADADVDEELVMTDGSTSGDNDDSSIIDNNDDGDDDELSLIDNNDDADDDDELSLIENNDDGDDDELSLIDNNDDDDDESIIDNNDDDDDDDPVSARNDSVGLRSSKRTPRMTRVVKK